MVEGHVGPLGRIRVGTSGWSYPGWVGPFYPPGTSAAGMLAVYAASFRTVEAHHTHRRTPTATALDRWNRQVPDDFRFAPKAHAGITHRRDLTGLGERVGAFFDALEPLGSRLGPVLCALPHRQPDLARLDALLDALAGRGPAVVELGPAWRVGPVRSRLGAAGVSLAVVDRDDDPAVADPEGGPGPLYVRLRRGRYGAADLDWWAGRLRDAAAAGRDVYAYFKHDEHGTGPRYARALMGRLEQP